MLLFWPANRDRLSAERRGAATSSVGVVCRDFRACLIWTVMAVLVLVVSANDVSAQLTAEHRRDLIALRREIVKATALIRRKETDEAQKILDEAEESLRQMMSAANVESTDPAIAGVQRSIDLQKQQLQRVMNAGAGNAAATGISFSKDVAPILAQNCVRCHGENGRGGLELSNFAGLRRGGTTGPLLVPGNPQRSLLAYRLIAPGQERMPRGGQPLNAADIKKITDWISQGAKYDHDDEMAALGDLGKPMKKKPEIKVAKPDGTETVSFKKDIAPMFVTFCVGCHSGANPASGLSMETFENILIGGDSGEVLIPGDLENSRLFRLTGGLENPRMPQGQARITRKNYEDLKAWISEGIKYDVDDPKIPLLQLVPTEAEKMAMQLQAMSESELQKYRQDRAEGHWRRTLSSTKPISTMTDQFAVYSNVELARMTQVIGWADEALGEIQQRFGLKEKPKWRGRLALYIFKDRYDYDEFNRSVENRQPAETLFGHGKVTDNFADAYVAVLDTGDVSTADRPALQWTLFKSLASAHLQVTAKSRPNWLLEGAGWALAGPSLVGGDFDKSMVRSAAGVLAALRRPEDLFENGTFAPDATEHVGYVTTRFLINSGGPEKFRQFATLILSGRNVNEACRSVYSADASALANSVRQAVR